MMDAKVVSFAGGSEVTQMWKTSPYWLSWPLGSALIKHHSLGGVYLHSSGGGESKIKGSVD